MPNYLGTTESDFLTFDFMKPDGVTPFAPTLPYVFESGDPAIVVGANAGNNKVRITAGATPKDGVVVTVTSPELPGKAGDVAINVVSNAQSGPVADTSPSVPTFQSKLG